MNLRRCVGAGCAGLAVVALAAVLLVEVRLVGSEEILGLLDLRFLLMLLLLEFLVASVACKATTSATTNEDRHVNQDDRKLTARAAS